MNQHATSLNGAAACGALVCRASWLVASAQGAAAVVNKARIGYAPGPFSLAATAH
jgi:hypothetical protein